MILLGDCLEHVKHIKNNSIDLVVTDPPYLINYKTNHRLDKDHKFCKPILNDSNESLITNIIAELYRVMKDNTSMYMFCSADKVDFFKQELEKKFTIKNMIIWVKNNHTAGDLKGAFGRKYEIIFLVSKGRSLFNGKRITDVWSFDRVTGKNQTHQNQKPLDLIRLCVNKHSNEGDLVLDPFAGSGTTGIACQQLNRQYILIEQDKEYFNVMKDRINKEKQCLIQSNG